MTSTLVVTTVVTPTVSASSGSSRSHSSSAGAIAGGVVGGIIGLGALFLLFWWCRRRSRKEDFDGDFDPDRVTRGGRTGEFDLAGDITPYPFGPGGQEMSQHGGELAAAGLAGAAAAAAGATGVHRSGTQGTQGRTEASAPSAYSQSDPTPSQYADYAGYATSSQGHAGNGGTSATSPTSPERSSYSGALPPGALPPSNDYRHPSPGPSLAMTNGTGDNSSSSGGGGNGGAGLLPSSKERETRGGRIGGALHVVNEPSPVVQHQDMGRVDVTPEDEDDAPAEIPPSYDSIRDRQ